MQRPSTTANTTTTTTTTNTTTITKTTNTITARIVVGHLHDIRNTCKDKYRLLHECAGRDASRREEYGKEE
ncbi:hypothetical protein E2C01_041786 [Portunus trituberculatus]|uniref:Uncharacterized protein n=1 Tax=Portunus trituberculatus TaxID=210409 RepID=A0A5B7FKS5_PORTR|nr:hypothetical protein [Portunus trituberculatus]